MGKALVFAAVCGIIIASVTAAIVLFGGAGKLASLMWRGGKRKRIRDQIEEQGITCPRCSGAQFVSVQHYCGS